MWASFEFAENRNRYTIGALLIDPGRKLFRYRMIGEGENLRFFTDPQQYLPFIALAEDKIESWVLDALDGKLLPYVNPHSKEVWQPWEKNFWDHVARLLNHQVRLSELLPIDLSAEKGYSFEEHFDRLYLSLVKSNLVKPV